MHVKQNHPTMCLNCERILGQSEPNTPMSVTFDTPHMGMVSLSSCDLFFIQMYFLLVLVTRMVNNYSHTAHAKASSLVNHVMIYYGTKQRQ